MEKICYMLFNLPRNWVDLAEYNLYRLLDPIIKRFSLYGGAPPKLASGSDNGGSRPRIIPHTELASSVRHRMLPLYHFLSLYFYLSLYLTIGEADLNLFHPQRWPHQSETGRWQIQGQGLIQEMWKKEIKTFDNLSFLAKLKLQLKSRPEKLRKLWERANYEIRPLSLFIPEALQT